MCKAIASLQIKVKRIHDAAMGYPAFVAEAAASAE